MLLDPGDGDVAASDLQVRLDLAQLLAELALYVGPDRAADLALDKAGADELVGVVPLLQRVALARSTRAELRRRRDVLPALRQRLLAAVPGGEVTPVRLERIRFRSLVTLVASVAAAYLLAGELARASLGHALRVSADWHWALVALALSAPDLRWRGPGTVRVRVPAATLPPHHARPAGRVLRHAGHARRRRAALPSTSATCSAGRSRRRSRRPASA